MASVALKQQLHELVASMYNEGLLDSQFDQIQALQDENNPGFIAEVITMFCEDSARILIELNKYLSQPVVEHLKVDAYVHQLKGSSTTVGAQRVKFACIGFHQACEENDKEGCLQALNLINQEYHHIRGKFEMMVQLEQRILAYDTKQQ